MRASAVRKLRLQQAQQPEAQGYTVAAPVGGLNARDALADMPETDAIILDNLFPQPTYIEIRGGQIPLAKFTGVAPSLCAYNSLSGINQLFAGISNSGVFGVYRVDTAGGGSPGFAVVGGSGNTVQSVTNVIYDWLQFGTGAAEILYLLNGTDNPLLYDGTTWWAITPVTATITGITQAASAVVTINTVAVSNPFSNGNTIGFSGVVGMTPINGLTGTVTATGGSSGDWTVTVNINSLGFPAYVSGGTANPYVLTSGPTSLSSLSQVVRYKSRLWFVQGGTFNVYYLPQNVFAGSLTLLNMAPNFNLGGSLAMIATNSVDNAAGINDYIAFISTQGEVVMYQGYDPASVTTWSEAAHFRIGRPLATGRRGWAKIGSDAAVLSVDGLTPLSKALVSDRSQPLIAITDKIRLAINNDAKVYGNISGWQVLLYPIGEKLIINTPTQVNAASYQYVQNTISGAWCTFGKNNSAWNALCFETMGDNLYYGASGLVAQCDSGQNDNGAPIVCTAKPAFSYMDDREHLKQFTQCQPIFQTSVPLISSILLNVDFETKTPTNTVPITAAPSTFWNVSLWNTPWSDAAVVAKPWIGLTGVGYAASMFMTFSTTLITAKWQSTNYLYKKGSLFYG